MKNIVNQYNSITNFWKFSLQIFSNMYILLSKKLFFLSDMINKTEY